MELGFYISFGSHLGVFGVFIRNTPKTHQKNTHKHQRVVLVLNSNRGYVYARFNMEYSEPPSGASSGCMCLVIRYIYAAGTVERGAAHKPAQIGPGSTHSTVAASR